MLSQLRTTVVAPQPPTTTPTIITTGQSRPFQPHPTSASQQFARHTRPAAVLHASPAQQPVFPTPSPDHVFALATPQQSPTTAPRTTNEFVNNWTSVNQPSYSLPSPSAMAGGAASWTDAEKIQLLVDILKDCDAAPNWRNIKVPNGRSVIQAQQVFASLTVTPPSSPQQEHAALAQLTSPRKRSFPEISAPPAIPTGPVVSSLNPAAAPPPKRKRGRPSKADLALREQQLRGGDGSASWQPQMYTPDASKGGVSLTNTTPNALLPGETPVKRKRGRPTKAEVERRERERQMLLEQQQRALQEAAATEHENDADATASAPDADADAEGEEDAKKDDTLSRASEDAAGDSPEE